MIGVEFQDISETMPFGVKHMVALLDDKLKGSLCGFIGALLLKDYDILVAFTEYNRNVIRLEPPLIVTREQCDEFIAALDDLLARHHPHRHRLSAQGRGGEGLRRLITTDVQGRPAPALLLSARTPASLDRRAPAPKSMIMTTKHRLVFRVALIAES